MGSLRILVVEDKPITAEDIKFSLEDMGYEVVDVAHSGGDALELLEKHKPDMVLLDIDLGEGMTGLQVGKIIHQAHKVPFLYLTARSDKETLDEARATRPAAYLVKPFTPKDLRAAIEIAMGNVSAGTEASPQQKSDGDSPEFVPRDNAIFVKHKGRYEKVPQSDILWIRAEDTYSLIQTAERSYLVSQTLKSVSGRLSYPKLIRVHRSHVVNIDHVEAIEDNMLIIGKTLIPVSKSMREEVMKHFELL